MSTRESRLQKEIRQTRPFRSRAQEASVGLARTADQQHRRLAALLEPSGLTPQQYNVLRILRGSHPDPLPTLEIGERMIEQSPGITRLLDRLEAKGLVHRQRCTEDRRLVHCTITAAGLELLAGLDDAVDRCDEALVAALSADETEQLIALLERLRCTDG
jgi:DNA-binding MarR family transcriptional regulator